jgi:hypothetical protein
MNATITHSDHATHYAFAPFKPQSTDEAIVAGIIRKMLHYHILRVQLEGARPWMHERGWAGIADTTLIACSETSLQQLGKNDLQAALIIEPANLRVSEVPLAINEDVSGIAL